jgi:hypothetical protein
MDHTEAIHGKFTERYLLGELAPELRDQFEEHFFECGVCAADVQAGAVLVDNARAILKPAPANVFLRFGLPFQAAACAFVCLLCVVGYENIVTIPSLRATGAGMRAPEILPAISLLGMGSRAETAPALAPAGKDFELELEIPGGPEFTGYRCEVRDSQSIVRFSLPVSAEQAKNTLRVAVPRQALGAGRFEVVVLGESSGQPAKILTQSALILQ